MIKTCSAGHNEVCWEHNNHPNGCPVCSQKKRTFHVHADNRDLICKLRDANIEIEKLKSDSWRANDVALRSVREKLEKAKEEIEKLKKDLLDTVERSNFAIREDGKNIRIAVERGKKIKVLEDEISRLQGELKCAFDHRQSFKDHDAERCVNLKRYHLQGDGGWHSSVDGGWAKFNDIKYLLTFPGAKDGVDVMKDDYFKMKKQRDDLLIKVEELEKMDRSSAACGSLMVAKQKIFALQSQVCDLLEQNARITMNAQMREDGYMIQEVRRLNKRIEELLEELEKAI